MLYHIFYALRDVFTPFNVFQYITFRAGGAVLTSLIICFIIGPYVIRKLTELKVGQTVRTDGPATHQCKSGTPTMGGVIILISIVSSVLLWARLDNRFILWLIAGALWLGFLGFWDDYLKLKGKNTKGVSAKGKLFFQTVFAATLAAYLSAFPANPEYATLVNVPFLKSFFVNLSFLYIVFAMIIVVGSSNAVNLTDGLDGLAIGNIVIVAFTLAVFAYLAGTVPVANYLKIIPVSGAAEISVFLAAIVGSGLGFLWYNSYPAQVFMGDTGSLFLGGVLGMSSIFIKQELILLLLGGVFVAEAVSVMIQISYYKRTKQRFFRMAPLHHHFEMSGLSETKVTIRFWIIGILLAILSFASLKLR
ncbi:phospho-N-acetylmuramoyl-pentapeptide-transferase [Endomicrobium proavitum]|uniref:Phospho-N-acetylmuramoyl-pentapeptide-transferase n=1 Tax=Endomicrobium proavitum TaxID=1408281 RepID=A0A0G3WIH2_9BACT|nr:phospho-N-acetylmuramoyl-pentapeptide-transferase [Endomicrobium proavitum]AKL97677.1 phospho-N-acetylmuramoyl-pentapeptide transferase [Endomicrobium proavitum]